MILEFCVLIVSQVGTAVLLTPFWASGACAGPVCVDKHS